MTGNFVLAQGKLATQDLMLNGPSAKINLAGHVDIPTHEISAEMVVMPNLTGTLPVATAIAAGNPALGAAVWVFDKIIGTKIQEINRLRYQIVGTWQAPAVRELPVMPQVARGMRSNLD